MSKSEIIADLPEDEYHDVDAVGSTLARALHKSIDHYNHKKDEQLEPTSSMKLGSWIHQAILEPKRWQEKLKSIPPVDHKEKILETAAIAAEHGYPDCDWEVVADKKTQTGKTASTCKKYSKKDGFDMLVDHYREHDYNPDRDVPTGDTLDKVHAARDSVLEHPLVQGGLLDGDTEISFFWEECPQDKPIQCKGRADFTLQVGGSTYLGDLKTVGRSPVTPGSFARVVGRRDYHMQAGQYCRGYEIASGEDIAGFIYLAVDTSAPHPVKAMTLDSEALQAGEEHFLDALTTLSEYRKGNIDYTGLDPAITEISLKQWEL